MPLCPEFLEIEHHREVVSNLLKFAKAVHRHNTHAHFQSPSQLEQQPTCGAESAAGQAPVRKKRAPIALIPNARLEELRKYIRENAGPYPFVEMMKSERIHLRPRRAHQRNLPRNGSRDLGENVGDMHTPSSGGDCLPTSFTVISSSIEEVTTAFQNDPASPLGVQLIDSVGDVHRFLSLHLASIHPEWVESMPAQTRTAEENMCDGNDSNAFNPIEDDSQRLGDGASGEVYDSTISSDCRSPAYMSLDTHGFFVVRTILNKYHGHESQTLDHAIGDFIYRWRRLFLSTMKPRFLPAGWNAEDGIIM